MAKRTVEVGPTFESWQASARTLLHDEVPPGDVTWHEVRGARDVPLLAALSASGPAASGPGVPRQFLDLARGAAGAADPSRWALLYELLWRLVHERRDLLADARDPQVRRLHALAAQARRESPAASDAAEA